MTDHTAASPSSIDAFDPSRITVSARDRGILSNLAAQVAELASRPIEADKRELWYRHNALNPTRPLVFCDPEHGWNEIISSDDLHCEGPLARDWDMLLRKEVFWATEMRDDRVTDGTFAVPHVYSETDWGMHETKIGGEDGGSYVWNSPVTDYDRDLPRLRFPRITVDWESTNRVADLAEEVLGKYLRVVVKTKWWWTLGMTWTLANLRGIERFMLDMYDYPDHLHQLMAFLRDGHLARLDFLEANGLLSPNCDGTYVGSGGFGWSRELQALADGSPTTTCQMWGFAESQETICVAPAMFAEFVLPYQNPIMDRFGLNCYGCCEPMNRRWEYVRVIPRLRRVSVSSWADVPDMAEKLGDQYIFSWKPQPADLAGPTFDEDAIRQCVRETLRATKNCHVEVIMKDNHTIGRDPSRVVRWVQIVREEIDSL